MTYEEIKERCAIEVMAMLINNLQEVDDENLAESIRLCASIACKSGEILVNEMIKRDAK